MPTTEEEFFSEKRPWSRMKDRILGSYLTPYLAKLAHLGRRILLVDAFAGPGVFADGSTGSPVMFCEVAEKQAPNQYRAIFVNSDAASHQALSTKLQPLIQQHRVATVCGSAGDMLRNLGATALTKDTLFLYLDPFGLKGCEFSKIEPILKRPQSVSTEVLINISVPTIDRLSTKNAIATGRATGQTSSLNALLTEVLGGEYWKDILWKGGGPEDVIAEYCARLRSYLPYVASCPVRESEQTAIKYFMILCSRHEDAIDLMNDIMRAAYQERMHEALTDGTLFAGTSWKVDRQVPELDRFIVQKLSPGERPSRKRLRIALIQDHFMVYSNSEWNKAIGRLCKKNGPLDFDDVRKTGRLNDESLIFLK